MSSSIFEYEYDIKISMNAYESIREIMSMTHRFEYLLRKSVTNIHTVIPRFT